MDPLNLTFLALALAGVAGFAFWFTFKSWRKERTVEDTPVSRIRSAAQGYVEFMGHAVALPDSETRGPLTGLPCAWWRFKIEGRGDGRSDRWSTVRSDTSVAHFMVDDGTGQCVVDPEGAEVYPGETSVWYGPNSWPDIYVPKGSGAFDWMVDHFVTDRYRYTEYRIDLKGALCVIGDLHTVSGLSVESPDIAVGELLRAWKADQPQLLQRFDTNHDGVLSSDEWDSARRCAREQVTASKAAEPPRPQLNVLGKPADGRAFLLSAFDARKLAARLRLKAMLGLVVFLAAVGTLTGVLTRVW
jgi:hypothetical protein